MQTTYAQETKSALPKEKQTALGLYVTSKDAYEKWKAAPEKVKILEVRTVEEYLFIGRAQWRGIFPYFFRVMNGTLLRTIFQCNPIPILSPKSNKLPIPMTYF